MLKVYFYFSEKILSGFVGCIYCGKKDLYHFVNTFNHFNFECKDICDTHCECSKCSDPLPQGKLFDCENIYLNRKSADTYFFPSVTNLWGIHEPCFLVVDKFHQLFVIKEPPAQAC